jgi:hypothetical protein
MTADVILCDDGQGSDCKRQARWLITTASPGGNPMCDLHAEWYLRQDESVYPRRRIVKAGAPKSWYRKADR